MNIDPIRELMRKGTYIEVGSELLQAFADYSEEARRLTIEMNNRYHTLDEVQEIFSQLFASKIDKNCIRFPLFYTKFGKNVWSGPGTWWLKVFPPIPLPWAIRHASLNPLKMPKHFNGKHSPPRL